MAVWCGRKSRAREKYVDKKIRPEGVWQTRTVESRLVPRFLDGEIDGKDRSLVGVYISREGGYDEKEVERTKKRKQEEEETQEGKGESEVSRLVTLVTEHRLAEKRKRKRSDARSSRKSLCLSFLFVVIASRSTCLRADVCVQKELPRKHSATLFYKRKGKKKITEGTVTLAASEIIRGSIGSLMKPSENIGWAVIDAFNLKKNLEKFNNTFNRTTI